MKVKWDELTTYERDKLIAEKVMGYKVKDDYTDHCIVWKEYNRSKYIVSFTPSVMIEDTWSVFKHVGENLFSMRKKFMSELQLVVSKRKGSTIVLISYPDVFWFVEPGDICLAALKTVGLDIE